MPQVHRRAGPSNPPLHPHLAPQQQPERLCCAPASLPPESPPLPQDKAQLLTPGLASLPVSRVQLPPRYPGPALTLTLAELPSRTPSGTSYPRGDASTSTKVTLYPSVTCWARPVGGGGYQEDGGLGCGQVPPACLHPTFPIPQPCPPQCYLLLAVRKSGGTQPKLTVMCQEYTISKPMRRDPGRGPLGSAMSWLCVPGSSRYLSGPISSLCPRADRPDSTIQPCSCPPPMHPCAVLFLQNEFPPPPLGALWDAVLTATGGAGRPLVATWGHNMAQQRPSPLGPTRGRCEGWLGSAYPLLFLEPGQAPSSGSSGPSGKRCGGFELALTSF